MIKNKDIIEMSKKEKEQHIEHIEYNIELLKKEVASLEKKLKEIQES